MERRIKKKHIDTGLPLVSFRPHSSFYTVKVTDISLKTNRCNAKIKKKD